MIGLKNETIYHGINSLVEWISMILIFNNEPKKQKIEVQTKQSCYKFSFETLLYTMLPSEINSTQVNKFFVGPCFFFALYCIYKGAYFGQGFQLCGHVLEIEDKF